MAAITCRIPLSNGFPEGHYIEIAITPLRIPVPAEREFLNFSTESKDYRLQVKDVDHFFESEHSYIKIHTEQILESDIPQLIEDLSERYVIIESSLNKNTQDISHV